jgi:hypothetical protein
MTEEARHKTLRMRFSRELTWEEYEEVLHDIAGEIGMGKRTSGLLNRKDGISCEWHLETSGQ